MNDDLYYAIVFVPLMWLLVIQKLLRDNFSSIYPPVRIYFRNQSTLLAIALVVFRNLKLTIAYGMTHALLSKVLKAILKNRN